MPITSRPRLDFRLRGNGSPRPPCLSGLIPSPLAKNRCGEAIFNRDNGACQLVGVLFDNQKTQRGLLERALCAFRPKVDSFWNVRMSQAFEWSALATSPRDKTQDFRHKVETPRRSKKSAWRC